MRERSLLRAVAGILFSGCPAPESNVEPTIEFTRLPPSGVGSPDKLHPIEGRVTGGQPQQQIVLFARSGIWWIQPTGEQPFTAVLPDSQWKNVTHPGSAYAALLVNPEYRPPLTADKLPQRGGDVLAVAIAESSMLKRPAPKAIQFGGYEWELREVASDRGGTRNQYDAANAWTDEKGFLHLRIGRREKIWTSAEVSLSRSLGYGSYHFTVREVSHLEPAAVFSIFTWDDSGPPREMDIQISRWGEPSGKNAQYVVQPYYVPANAVRFMAPAGALTHSFRWEPGRVSFKTVRGSADEAGQVVDEHTFTSGVPSPGNESIHMNLYVFDNKSNPMRRETEVWSLRSSNTSRNGWLRRRRAWLWIVACFAATCANSTYAVDPNRATSQYIRDRWGSEQGFPRGPVYAITQTTDGYLWIGTEAGLLRFDGWSFHFGSWRATRFASPERGAGPM